ncbi:MAG: ATP-binding protein [Ktedonobacterales bacterium]
MYQESRSSQPPDATKSAGATGQPAAAELPTPALDLAKAGGIQGQWLGRLRSTSARLMRHTQDSLPVRTTITRFASYRAQPYSGPLTLVVGTVLITLLLLVLRRLTPLLPNPGVAYLPLIAMLAYYWSWGLVLVAAALQLLCVYFLFTPPELTLKPRASQDIAELLVLIAVSGFILALVQLAKNRRAAAEWEAARFASLNAVGTALASEHNRDQLLHLIARTACELTGAGFAAFTLRPLDAAGQPLVPPAGNLFHLAAVVGVTPEQEAFFRQVPLGGEGLLAPIFHHGAPVRVGDAVAVLAASRNRTAPSGYAAPSTPESRLSAGETAGYQTKGSAVGRVPPEELRAVGVPTGHPTVRSFLGAPLLARDGQVRGGLLLGHSEPNRFTQSDEAVLQALAAQAAVVLENARLYQAAQDQAEELSTVFESIADAVVVYDPEGHIAQENHAADAVRRLLAFQNTTEAAEQSSSPDVLMSYPTDVPVTLRDELGEQRDFLVSASRLRPTSTTSTALSRALESSPTGDDGRTSGAGDDRDAEAIGTVVVWHEVTEARKLLSEQLARSEAEAQRTILQVLIDELPSGVCLLQGAEARLVLANRAAQTVMGSDWQVGQPLSLFLDEHGIQFTGTNGQPLPTEELASLRALRRGTAVRHSLEVIHRLDGTALPLLINAVSLDPVLVRSLPLRDGHAKAGGDPVVLVVFQDVTALKEAERLKDEFIAVAAHELKTPMASVKGYADMLVHRSIEDKQAKLSDWQLEALETIDQATNRLVELTDDLLDVARLQADHLQLHQEPHDLIALTRRVVKRFQIVSGRHTLSLATNQEFVVACLDVRRTEQIIGNLLSNAIKYSPAGGSISISIRQDSQSGMAELAVTDPGIGIPEDQQALLFNRFARAENARELGITGTGLGLYLCRELVERQGGHIRFTSKEGRGSTFWLSLPLATDP